MKNVKKSTAPTWNKETTAKVVEAYNEAEKNNEKLAEIAADMKMSVAQVRGKLVAEKVYVANPKKSVGGASPVRKISLVREIATKLGFEDVSAIDSFEKASKPDLQKVVDLLNKE